MNRKILFNDGWEFAKSSLEEKNPNALVFTSIDIPHDWLIYNTLNLYENSIGWYRKSFFVTEKVDHILLYFEGVYMDSSLYVNGKFIGEWKYGYSSFEHEITGAVKEGENELLVKVVHQSPNSRWYSGAGIYRNVWMKTRNRNHIVTDGIYISTKEMDDGWEVEIETDLITDRDVMISCITSIIRIRSLPPRWSLFQRSLQGRIARLPNAAIRLFVKIQCCGVLKSQIFTS